MELGDLQLMPGLEKWGVPIKAYAVAADIGDLAGAGEKFHFDDSVNVWRLKPHVSTWHTDEGVWSNQQSLPQTLAAFLGKFYISQYSQPYGRLCRKVLLQSFEKEEPIVKQHWGLCHGTLTKKLQHTCCQELLEDFFFSNDLVTLEVHWAADQVCGAYARVDPHAYFRQKSHIEREERGQLHAVEALARHYRLQFIPEQGSRTFIISDDAMVGSYLMHRMRTLGGSPIGAVIIDTLDLHTFWDISKVWSGAKASVLILAFVKIPQREVVQRFIYGLIRGQAPLDLKIIVLIDLKNNVSGRGLLAHMPWKCHIHHDLDACAFSAAWEEWQS